MKYYAFLLLWALLAPSSPAHAHEKPVDQELRLHRGKKWPTDASLRTGMSEIRAALPPQNQSPPFSKQDYARRGKKINASLNEIFKSCKLSAEADAMLHVLLAKIIVGATQMEDKTSAEKQLKGAEAVAKAVEEYPKFFDHPNW